MATSPRTSGFSVLRKRSLHNVAHARPRCVCSFLRDPSLQQSQQLPRPAIQRVYLPALEGVRVWENKIFHFQDKVVVHGFASFLLLSLQLKCQFLRKQTNKQKKTTKHGMNAEHYSERVQVPLGEFLVRIKRGGWLEEIKN